MARHAGTEHIGIPRQARVNGSPAVIDSPDEPEPSDQAAI